MGYTFSMTYERIYVINVQKNAKENCNNKVWCETPCDLLGLLAGNWRHKDVTNTFMDSNYLYVRLSAKILPHVQEMIAEEK